MKFKRILILLVAAVMACGAFTACGKKTADEIFDDNDGFYTIQMYLPVNTPTIPVDLKVVQNALNVLLKDKINAEVKITSFIMNEYNGKMNTKIGNYEDFDLVWTDFESYYRYVEMEALYPMNYVLDKYGPNVKADFDAQLWEQVTHSDGKIYAAINNQILPRTFGVHMRDSSFFDEFLTLKNLDEEKICRKEFAERLDVIEDYMAWLRLNKSGQDMSAGGITHGFELVYALEALGFDGLGMSMTVPGVVRADADGAPTVVNQFKEPEFVELIYRMKDWYDKGYIPADIDQREYGQTDLDVLPARTWKPEDKQYLKVMGTNRLKRNYRFGESFYIQSYIMGTMWGISATSKNPARTMKFIDLMHSDPEVHNMLKLGVEGTHYTLGTDGRATLVNNGERYNLDGVRWLLGNELIGYPLDYQDADVFEKTKAINEETPVSKVIGFRFNKAPVTTEIQLCSAQATQVLSQLNFGKALLESAAGGKDYYQQFLEDIERLGASKIIKEKQKQLDAWLAAK